MSTNSHVRLTDSALRRSVQALLEPWIETAPREELERVLGLIDELLAVRDSAEDEVA
jgi:hypothetical protein